MKDITLSKVIGNIGIFIDGDWIESKDQDQNGDVRLIQLADIGDGNFLNRSARFLTAQKAKELNCTFLKPGDLLIARMPDPLGRACIFPGDDKPCVTAVDVCIVRPDNKIADAEWLKFQINNHEFRNKIKKFTTGTTRQRISRSNLAKLKFKLPQLPDQFRIATILNKAEVLIAQRKESLRLLDELLKSSFLEMFGDIRKNDKKWSAEKLGKLFPKNSIVDGPFGSAISVGTDYIEDGEIPIIRTVNIKRFNFSFEDLRFIRRETYERIKRSNVKPGDILISKVGTIGNVCIFPDKYNEAALSTTGSTRIRNVNPDLHSIYFLYYLEYYKPFMIKMASQGVQSFLNLSHIKSFKILLPPRELQAQFAQIVEKVEALKAHYQSSLKELEYLYGSLSQRAFKGELDLRGMELQVSEGIKAVQGEKKNKR
jgi:type I restriction enzyme S subunit